jgi:protein involved in polysaccharide export with SLBB domain
MSPGDIVSILEADQAFVVGNVKDPKTIMLKEPITLTGAIAKAGGILPATKKKSIFLIRQDEKGNKTKIPVDLNAIKDNKAADPFLQPNDIIEVPEDGGKVIRNSVIKALTGGLSSLPFLIP